MQELVGRLTALDPQASETLKVIAYFDALVAGGARMPAIVRAAATLAGVTAGAMVDGESIRYRPDGTSPDVADPSDWPSRPATSRDWVWIERTGPAHANDAMVLERFALAIALRREGAAAPAEDALHVVLDAERTPAERAEALARLSLPPGELRIALTMPIVSLAGPSTLVATRAGALRATVVGAAHPFDEVPSDARIGIGPLVPAGELHRSLTDAELGFRLADDGHRRIDAADLGILLDAVRAAQSSAPEHPDVTALRRLDPGAAAALAALAQSESIRQAAQHLGVHHSTLQARHERLTHDLGWDPRTASGRARYAVAALLVRLTP